MKKTLGLAIVAGLSIISTQAITSPAQAAGKTSKDGIWLYFNASPEPVKKCGKVTLSAEVFDPTVDDQTGYYVSFVFKRSGTKRWVLKKMKSVAYNGRATATAQQCYSGTWAAGVWAGDWEGPIVYDKVKVR